MTCERENLRIVAFEVTRRCRYACRHCRAEAGMACDTDPLSTQQCKHILKALKDFCKPMVIITGGEPMERQDIFELIGFGSGLGLRMAMATCGYKINSDSLNHLKQAGLGALSISIDGATAESNDRFRGMDGAFKTAIRAAKTARETGVWFQVNTTISRINVSELEQIAKLSQELGASCWNPFVIVPMGRGRQISDAVVSGGEYDEILKRLLALKLNSPIEVRVTCGPQFARLWKQKAAQNGSNPVSGCLGGREFGFISYKGDVQTCGFLDVSAGSLLENRFDFGIIWRQSQFLKKIRSVNEYKGPCGVCEYGHLCGGCRARAYAISGDYLASDEICNYGQ